MRLGELCPAPCFAHAPAFAIPPVGCDSAAFKFGSAEGRDYYAVLLRNHDIAATPKLNPRVAIVGLSPAGNQIAEFVETYKRAGDYGTASIAGAFAGLAADIIAMMNGLGLTARLGLALPDGVSFSRHPDIYVTSLVACATLTTTGSSTDFDPGAYSAARRCMTQRFVGEMLNPAYNRLTHIIILGSKGWDALRRVRLSDGNTVHDALRRQGKILINLPHPSPANREYVNLASLPSSGVPTMEAYVDSMWEEYCRKPPKKGRRKQGDAAYKAKRRAAWLAVDGVRRAIAQLGPPLGAMNV